MTFPPEYAAAALILAIVIGVVVFMGWTTRGQSDE